MRRGVVYLEEQWVLELRQQFSVTQKTIFLDIAYENCGAYFVRDAFNRYLEDWSDVSPGVIKAGGEGKGNIIGVVAETRRLLAGLIGGVEPNCIAFTKNTNEGINAILQGYSFKSSDNIITNDQEHSSVIMPCLNLKSKGVECRVVTSPDGVSITPEMLLERADAKTRFIIVSHVQSRSGYKIDLDQLSILCQERGIYLIVDAIQSLGFIPFDAKASKLSAVASSCYKGLLGLEGLGFLYIAPDLLDKITPTYVAANSFTQINERNWKLEYLPQSDARKLENSTMNFGGIYVLNEALHRINKIGIEKIAHHISVLYDHLYNGLTKQGFAMITPRDPHHHCHSMSITCSNPRELYNHFQNHCIFVSFSAGRFVRLSIAPFTTMSDVEMALSVANLWVNQTI